MAVVSNSVRTTVSMILDTGAVDAKGNIITKTVNLPGVANNPDVAKVHAVASAIGECLEYDLHKVQMTKVTEIADE